MRYTVLCFCLLGAASLGAYDPLDQNDGPDVKVIDLSFVDESRDRELPLRVYLPDQAKSLPVILFSHGLGGSRKGAAYLGNHWSRRGYVVVMMQHPGSDESVWKAAKLGARMQAMRKAASARNFNLRVGDVAVVIDRLQAWNAESGHRLEGSMDLERIGMSGHSFGAKTTQAVSGESFMGEARFTDYRIDAACAFSPSPPQRASTPKDAEASFSKVGIPWMLMTGTEDESVIGNTTPEQRTWVFPALPPGDKYQLILAGAEHLAFSDRAARGSEKRNPNHHRVILALSSAFWDAYLKQDAQARAWLTGNGPRDVMEPADRWEMK